MHVGALCREMTNTAVAEAEYFHDSTVKDLDTIDMQKQVARAGLPAPRAIGVDEFAIRKGHHYHLVVSDRGRPIRRSCNPSAPSASYRPLQRRNVRSVTPSISAASAIVTSRCCRRAYNSSNRICLTSCRILARVIVALLEGSP
jgi:hypothetical protein